VKKVANSLALPSSVKSLMSSPAALAGQKA